ncbi:hypothetical protein ACVIGB_000809 [Bradyrhizobium sp. USDA 4341]
MDHSAILVGARVREKTLDRRVAACGRRLSVATGEMLVRFLEVMYRRFIEAVMGCDMPGGLVADSLAPVACDAEGALECVKMR